MGGRLAMGDAMARAPMITAMTMTTTVDGAMAGDGRSMQAMQCLMRLAMAMATMAGDGDDAR